ncbi:CobW family GTP-binding protein [Cohaesibacter intestini]|uniref:CobW family GTP-binding protein n=1 Tax=Cohaesibacter intestini TaxID=2211145 RepID=UPI001300B8D6|nr:GTP-binding protein [Cohaesibacter intestini]
MIELSKLLPPHCQTEPSFAASHLPRATMMRVNFIPGVRQRLGWRGMRACPQAPMSQTAKIDGMTGIYGIKPEGCIDANDTGIATFSIFYFPDPEEEILNQISLSAGIVVYGDQYSEMMRDFPQYPDMASLFHIADMELRFTPDKQLTLSLVAPERDRVLAMDGIYADTDAGRQMLVEPQGAEQDLPCWSLAYPFFETVATSFSYVFEAAPAALRLQCARHPTRLNHADGKQLFVEEDDNPLKALRLTWMLEDGLAPIAEADIDARQWKDADPGTDFDAAKWNNPLVPGARHSMDKSTMGIEELPKLIILTGFLGSGKTSFLSHFIDYQASRNLFVAVIQNEIGERGLDARLLGQHYAVKEIDEGCICCTLIDNLTVAIDQICSQYQPDFLIVETTGLANPANLLSELSELQDRLEFCSVTCMLDALNGGAALPNYAILQDQIRVADTVLINKVDLVESGQIDHLKHEVRALNPYCSLHETREGDISPRELYGVNFEGQHREANMEIEPCGCSHDGHGEKCVTHHHYGIRSQLWRPTGRISKEQLRDFLLGLPPTIFRVKGLLRLDDADSLTVCQHVPSSVQLVPYRGQDDPAEFLVFIGEGPEEAIAQLNAILPHLDQKQSA